MSVRLRSVSTEAANTSFHEMTKAKMAVAAMPGRASGQTTFQKAWRRLQPSVQAASSSSRGMPTNRLELTSVAKGSARAVWTSATASTVS